MLSFRDLQVRYGAVAVLRDVSADVSPSALTALIGPNGTGKSSLLKALAGLVPSSGAVSLAGDDLPTSADRGRKIAYMQQDIGPTSSLTVLEVVLLGRLSRLGLRIPADLLEEAASILATFGVADLLDRTLAEISGGQRQLVYLTQSLFRKPQVLLLDEPTAALDLRHQLIVLEAVKSYAVEHGVVVMAAMHDLTLSARFADRMICLSNGTIVADGKPQEIMTADTIEAVYGVEARIRVDEDSNLSVFPVRAVNPLPR